MSSVVINDLNIDRAKRALWPFETNPPLLVDPNAVLTLAITFKRFQTVARQIQVWERSRGVKLVKLHLRLTLEPREDLDSFASGELAGTLVAIGHDHGDKNTTNYALRKA